MSLLRFMTWSFSLIAVAMLPVLAADRTPVILGTATPGGGLELYGGVLVEEVNRVAPDLIGKRVAGGTRSFGLTLLSQYVNEALGLDRDKDFNAVYLERATVHPWC